MVRFMARARQRWSGTLRGGASPRGGIRLALALLMLVGVAPEAYAVAVSPTALYIDSRSRTGTVTLYNPGALPEEIEIGFAFGYPTSDPSGNISVPLTTEAPEGEPSAVEWMRAFPRRLVLQPGQRQVVRIMVTPPAGLAEGEYWARLLITSRGGQPPIEQTVGGVTTQIEVETVMVLAVNYRNGRVHSGVSVTGSEVRREGEHVLVASDLQRNGNAAFLGRIRAELLDEAGRVVGTEEQLVAVYRGLRSVIRIPVPADARGPFQVRLTVDTTRDDLPPEGPLPADPVSLVVPQRVTR